MRYLGLLVLVVACGSSPDSSFSETVARDGGSDAEPSAGGETGAGGTSPGGATVSSGGRATSSAGGCPALEACTTDCGGPCVSLAEMRTRCRKVCTVDTPSGPISYSAIVFYEYSGALGPGTQGVESADACNRHASPYYYAKMCSDFVLVSPTAGSPPELAMLGDSLVARCCE